MQQELARAAATGLTRQVEAERQAGAMAARLAAVEEQLRACLAGHGPKEEDNPGKRRARTEPVVSRIPPAKVGNRKTY